MTSNKKERNTESNMKLQFNDSTSSASDSCDDIVFSDDSLEDVDWENESEDDILNIKLKIDSFAEVKGKREKRMDSFGLYVAKAVRKCNRGFFIKVFENCKKGQRLYETTQE